MKLFYKKKIPNKFITKYYFLGIQIWHKKDRYKRKLNDIIEAKLGALKSELMTWFSYSTDLTKLPKTKGPFGIMQKAEVVFLKAITDVFDKHHIRYALWAGSAMGALRHGGFIPWDDDIDLLIPDEDYYRIEKVIAEEFKNNPDIYTTNGDCIRIFCRGTTLQIDCFSFWTYQNYFDNQNDREKLKDEIERYNKKCYFDPDKLSIERTLDVSDEQIDQWMRTLLKPNPNEKRKMIVSRIGIFGRPDVYDYNWIFPLKKIKFFGVEFYGPNDPELMCYARYGDYMKLPPDFHIHQDIFDRLTPLALAKMKKIIEENKIQK